MDHLLLSTWIRPINGQHKAACTNWPTLSKEEDGQQGHPAGFWLDQDPLHWQLSNCHQQGAKVAKHVFSVVNCDGMSCVAVGL